ncbi:Der1-like family-domain-containing protein [Thelonectria olida]|uniref:Derlin n=1 Tax=Thelonectria olida TaxID=1576542 RepID=A0A9P9ANL0_9HYPO|nr:Der1-like family-domain-containing protein [Thelonectria olida]
MAENNFLDGFWQLPAISRTLTAATVTLSLGVHLGFIPVGLFVHHPSYLWSIPPQIWRPVTSFLITGGGLGLLFDSYFLYHYLSQLELSHPRFPRKADLLWYLIFVSGTILTINYFADLPFYTFLGALILAMAYTVTQDQRGMKATFYIITVPAQLTPICMIGINLLFPGGAMNMLLQLEGLVAAHLYDFLSRLWPQFGGGPNILATPPFLHRLLRTPRALNRSFGTSFRGTDSASGSSTGASTGPLPDSWKSRGAGQRLG